MIAWLVGLALIAVGVLWLMSLRGSRRTYAAPPAYGPPPARPPYP